MIVQIAVLAILAFTVLTILAPATMLPMLAQGWEIIVVVAALCVIVAFVREKL